MKSKDSLYKAFVEDDIIFDQSKLDTKDDLASKEKIDRLVEVAQKYKINDSEIPYLEATKPIPYAKYKIDRPAPSRLAWFLLGMLWAGILGLIAWFFRH
jgi:hypothetical protein